MKFLFPLFVILLFPSIVNAAADLVIEKDDIHLSKSPLVVGDEVRIYATIRNIGDIDIVGYVTFYQGVTLIGDSQVISVLANGNPEEVFVDFVIPSGQFNIQTSIKGTVPADVNISNDVAVTGIYSPVFDDDRDGIVNELDNCPSVANADQTNSDDDAYGNACDDDDDNDGITDDVENELGSNPLLTDSDMDNFEDADDVYPSDPGRHADDFSAPEDTDIVQNIIRNVVDRIQESDEIEERRDSTDSSENSDLTNAETDSLSEAAQIEMTFSPNAVFSYSRRSWNTFDFRLLGPEDAKFAYQWDFGDGVTSSKTTTSHTYVSNGVYVVTLSVINSEGGISSESVTVSVPFFSLSNSIVLVSVLFLSIFLIVCLVFVVVTSKRKITQTRDRKEFSDRADDDVTRVHVREE